MSANSLAPATRLGYVHLNVSDLGRALPFYQEQLGFQLHRRERDTARLGAGGPDLLLLTERPGAPRPRRATGLYHFAILVPSRLALARSLKRLTDTETRLQGVADHHVSEALYLADPDGNGIEIYRDRPREQWLDAQGKFLITTGPLDLQGIVAELPEAEREGESSGFQLDPATVLGHMHLQVASLRAAEAFYRSVIAFDLMMRMEGSAAFLSAGGYHHHLGINTWGTAGAPPPPPDALGLRHFVIRLTGADELSRVAGRVTAAGLPVQETEEGLVVRDPSQNAVLLTTAG